MNAIRHEDEVLFADATQSVDAELRDGFPLLRFSPELERSFIEDGLAARRRHLMWTGAIGVALADLFIVFDWQLITDVFAFDCILRFLVFTPLGLLTMIIGDKANPDLREALWGAMCVFAVGLVMLVSVVSASPTRDTYGHIVVLVMMFTAGVQRLRFRYATSALLVMVTIYTAVTALLTDTPVPTRVANSVFVSTAAVLMIAALYALEREQRHSYLLGLRARILTEEFKRAALIDPLTGLGNRRHLEFVMRRAWRDCLPSTRMAVLLLDIDHFKTFNDANGHLAGDECLRRVSACIRETLGADACAVRFGGEEFLVLLENADDATALDTAETVRRAVGELAIRHPSLGPSATVRVSIGVAAATVGLVEPRMLVTLADEALYQAKGDGRDRVVLRALQQGSAAHERAA